jgi:hypothetical protein
MEPKRSDSRGDKNLITLFAAKQKGCMNTNKVKEDLNERCQRGPKPKPKPTQLEVERRSRGKPKSQRHRLLEEHEKHDNVFGDVPCHAMKIMTHT